MNEYNENTYFSPTGNPEIWLEKPEGYYTPEEWEALNPPPVPTPEEIQASYTRLIQSILDNEAYKLGYTGANETVEGACNSVCTYIDTGISKFDDERTCFQAMAFRSLGKGL